MTKVKYMEADLLVSKYYIESYLKIIGEDTFLKKTLGDLYDTIVKVKIKEFNIGHSWFAKNPELLKELRKVYKEHGFETAKDLVHVWVSKRLIQAPQCNSGLYPDDITIQKWVDEAYWYMCQSNRKLREILTKYNVKNKEIKKRLSASHKKFLDNYTSKNYKRKPRRTLAEYNIGISVEDIISQKFFSHNDAGEVEEVTLDYSILNKSIPEDTYTDGVLDGNLAIKIDEVNRISICMIYRDNAGISFNNKNTVILDVTPKQVEFLRKFMIDYYTTSSGIKSECIKKDYNKVLYNYVKNMVIDLNTKRTESSNMEIEEDSTYEIVDVTDRIKMQPDHILEKDLYDSYMSEHKIYKRADRWISGDLAICYDSTYRKDINDYDTGFNIVYRKNKRSGKTIPSGPHRLYISSTLASKLKNKAKREGCNLSKDKWLFEDENPDLFQYFRKVMADLHKVYGISDDIL